MGVLRIRVIGAEGPVPGVRIFWAEGPDWTPVGRTDEQGEQAWKVDPAVLPVNLRLEPASGYWAKYLRFDEAEGKAEVLLEALPRSGPTGWWHECVGAAAGRLDGGRGIRVGLVDTGYGPSSCLSEITAGGAWLDGSFLDDPDASKDVVGHGTHVAGLLAARPCRESDYVGIAPGVDAVVVRVFSAATEPADHDDVANAIEHLVRRHHVHLVNLSLGASTPSDVERDAIEDALDNGALVLAAAGNGGGTVWYPAAYEEVVAVAAIGKRGEGSELTRAGFHVPSGYSLDGPQELYPADFSNHGLQVTCVAPGVDVISTVPSSSDEGRCLFAGQSGTSMSTPIACGALAIRLAADEEYQKMKPTRRRADRAREILLRSCRDLEFERVRQGGGLPTVR